MDYNSHSLKLVVPAVFRFLLFMNKVEYSIKSKKQLSFCILNYSWKILFKKRAKQQFYLISIVDDYSFLFE